MDPPKISPRGKRKAGLATHEMESEKKLKSEEKQQVFRHDLLGREILRQWVDRNLNERKLYGTVRKCFKDPLEESKYLDIEYSDESITVAQEIMPGWTLSKWEKGVPEEVAVSVCLPLHFSFKKLCTFLTLWFLCDCSFSGDADRRCLNDVAKKPQLSKEWYGGSFQTTCGMLLKTTCRFIHRGATFPSRYGVKQ